MKAKVLLAWLLALALPAVPGLAADAPYLPGITTPDDHPNGCVSCHVLKEGDVNPLTLNLTLARISTHPKVDTLVKKIPTDCLMCHKDGSKADNLFARAHKAHFGKLANSLFIKNYQGACLNCHVMDLTTFNVAVKSGPKNW